MGKLYEEFGSQTFRNEAEVSQKFILPLLVNYLGYDLSEIIPEQNYPAKDLYSGVKFHAGGSKFLNHRPDFVVCLDGVSNEAKFIIDSKAPDEDIDSHFGQLRSYAISVNRNLLMMTNGKELKVYDVNTLLFHSKDIADLQIKISLLKNLIGREAQSLKSVVEIIKDFDLNSAIDISNETKLDQEIKRKQILLADFEPFLQKVATQFSNWHMPTIHFQALNNLDFEKIDPYYLLTFKIHGDQGPANQQKQIKLTEIETDRRLNIKIFIGETGVGKSCMLRFLAYQAAKNCLNYREIRIPVFISLRDIGHGYKLEDLIVGYLNQYGYRCMSYYDLPETNDFVFFLDAYDEVIMDFQLEVFQAIERLSSKFECYLTTRPNKIPPFTPSMAVDVLPMSEKQIEKIVRKHIDAGYYNFQRQIENNGLRNECGNILLLLSLISLFKESGALPSTATRIVRAVVERIKTWQDSKHKQKGELNWDAAEQLLGVLAYRLIESNEISLTRKECESMLVQKILELEQDRQVKPGLTIQKIIDNLSETGVIIVNSDHLYFWHRLLLNHFAACGLKNRYEHQPSLIRELTIEDRWSVAIVGLASHLDSVSQLLEYTTSNLWLSAYCLAENSNCDEAKIKGVVDKLHEELHSPVADIRSKAVLYLSEIDHPSVKKMFFDIIDGHYALNVRVMSLSVIGKTRSSEARDILWKHLNWETGEFFRGPSAQAHIARGLYYYGEEEHLQIIENWKKSKDWWMDEECNKIFVELHGQQKLTPQIIAALEKFFLSEYKVDPSPPYKMSAIAKILSLVPNDIFATTVIEKCFEKEQIGKIDAVSDLLKEYNSPAIIEHLKREILRNTDKHYTIEKLTEAITDNTYPIPKEIFYELSNHPNINVASKAVSALSRFPFSEVKVQVEKHLYGEQPQLQSWALDVFINNGEIVYLIRSHKFPNPFFLPTAHNLLKAVRRYHIAEGLSQMERIFNALSKNDGAQYEFNLALDLAGTYYFMGQKEKHDEIISWYFDGKKFLHKSDTIHFHIMIHLKFFNLELSIKLAECYFNTYYPFSKDNRFKMDRFLETAEELGRYELVPLIKKAADLIMEKLDSVEKDDDFSGYHMERPLRALAGLATTSDEDWLLERLDKLDYETFFEFPQLRRALECLVNAGTSKSLPHIKKIARQRLNEESVINICYIAYEQICRREKIPFSTSSLIGS